MLDLSRVLYIETWVCLAPKRVPPVKILDFPDGADGKACAYNAGDPVRSLGREDPLEKEMATHSRTLAWKAPRTQEPVGYSPRVANSRTRLSDFTSHKNNSSHS